MFRNSSKRSKLLALALACCATISSGCATWQGPRIDPTGERLLLWPGESPTIPPPPTILGPAPVAGAPIVVPPPVAPRFVQPLQSVYPSAPFGNVLAPPVYSDPAMTPIPVAPPVASTPAPVIPAAPVSGVAPALPLPPPGIAPTPVIPAAVLVPYGAEHLQIMPMTLIAPVGSEMLLKASILSGDGRLRANQRIDWSIAANSVGQFTEMGFRDRGQLLGLLEVPHKIDDWSAISSTAVVPITLNTATPDPNDDIPILRGEAWVTLSSPSEGTTVVTANAPWLSQYNQATATIQWIDAQWVFTQTAAAEAGRPHALTTNVMRRTDGAPLAGWIVRYDVAGGAALGYEGGNSVESTTDAAGRASVEVSPKNAAGGVTNVGITIIRPATAGPIPMQRLELGRAATTITWGAAVAPAVGVPALPTGPVAPGTPLALPAPPSTFGPPPALPPAVSQPAPAPNVASPAPAPPPNPYTPPAAATGKPRLEVTLGAAEPKQVAVGQNVTFLLTVTNRGDGVARHIKIGDTFDRGLRHPAAAAGVYHVEYLGMRDLQPNETDSTPLTFRVVDAGMQCHDVTVTADGADPVTQHGCVTAQQASLTVNANGPVRQIIGETAKVNAVIKNTGEVAATNIEIVARCNESLQPVGAGEGHELLADGGILLRIDRLEPGERRTFGIAALCRAASNKACVRFLLSADGGLTVADETCFEILPLLTGATPGGGAAVAPAIDLRLSVSTNSNPGRVGQKQVINVTVANAGQQVERQVATRILLPQELTVDPTSIQPQSEATVLGQEIRFAPISELQPGQQKQYVVPVTPNRTGKVQASAQVAASSLTTPKTVDSDPIDILGASP